MARSPGRSTSNLSWFLDVSEISGVKAEIPIGNPLLLLNVSTSSTETGRATWLLATHLLKCANGDPADAQTEYRKEMEKDFVASPLGLGLMGYLVFRSGPVAVWKQLQAVGWGFAFVILLGGSLNRPRHAAGDRRLRPISVGFPGVAVYRPVDL
jgi:hypothetical protein